MARLLFETVTPSADGAAPADVAPPQVINQNPAGGATAVATATTIVFDVVDVGSGINLSTVLVDITVGATPVQAAYDGAQPSPFQGSWTGTVTPIVGGYRFSITDGSGPLPELTAITVRVQATDLSPLLNSVDTSWSFTTADETAPTIVNLSPVSGAVGVSEATDISFRILDAGSGVDTGTIDVDITEGTLGSPAAAIVGGVVQAPYNGPNTAITPGAGFVDVVIDRVGDLPTNDTVTVAVAVNDLGGNAGSRTWAFSTSPPPPPPPPPEVLPVPAAIRAQIDMYPFLVRPIREADRLEGQDFLRRLIDGFNDAWATMLGELARLADLKDPLLIPRAIIRDALALLGWARVERFDAILEGLDELTLRRLMRFSGRLWNARAPEDMIRDLLRAVLGVRVRIWNWFDFRWVLAQTGLAELHRTNDPWLIDLPIDFGGSAADEYRTNIRIVDPGGALALDRVLLRRLLNLVRPVGERYRITYLLFLDTFVVAGDDVQWFRDAASTYAVTAGVLQLAASATEATHAIVTGASSWSNYLVATKIRGTSGASGQRIAIRFYYVPAGPTYYATLIDFVAQTIELVRVDAGVSTSLGTVSMGALTLRFVPSAYFTLRIEAFDDSTPGATRIRVRFDGFTLFDLANPSGLTGGTLGYAHDAGATLEVDDVEIMPIPGDTEEFEINSNP